MTNPEITRKFTLDEYRKLSDKSLPPGERKALFVVNREVYDATPFLTDHPGGDVPIWAEVGKAITAVGFLDIHGDEARKQLIPVSPSYFLV